MIYVFRQIGKRTVEWTAVTFKLRLHYGSRAPCVAEKEAFSPRSPPGLQQKGCTALCSLRTICSMVTVWSARGYTLVKHGPCGPCRKCKYGPYRECYKLEHHLRSSQRSPSQWTKCCIVACFIGDREVSIGW